jgi:hypothetical protein
MLFIFIHADSVRQERLVNALHSPCAFYHSGFAKCYYEDRIKEGKGAGVFMEEMRKTYKILVGKPYAEMLLSKFCT